MSSSSPPQCKHDIFVSFRGKDVRRTFIPNLIDRLEQEGFSYFYDEEPEDAGKRIKDKIFLAIHHARVALIVLSKNYADSKWCMNELVEILKCSTKPKNLVVIPVFYEVDPNDVGKLKRKSKLSQVFEKGRKEGENGQQIEIWEKALQEVKKFSGFVRKNFSDDVELCKEVIRPLYTIICKARCLDLLKNAIGAGRLATDVIPLLKIGPPDVRMIGISGAEGIGKTMVARAVCEGILDKFDRFIFFDEVGKAEPRDFGKLHQKLLQNLLGMNRQMTPDSLDGNINRIKANLPNKKILLVVDGVTEKEQIKKLGVEDRRSFRNGSRILITTGDRNLLKDLEVDDEYIVKGLTRDEAFRFFCRHAFKREEPEEGYEELSRYLAHYAGGHPLALSKWGSFLNGQLDPCQWRDISNQLVNRPDLIKSVIQDSVEIFIEYPREIVGPCGGDRSSKPWKDEGYTGVRKIEVGIDSEAIKFITIVHDERGSECEPVTRGTKRSGTPTIQIELDYPREYLNYMSGHTKEDSGHTILQSLTFYTNRGHRKSIGTNEEGRKFSFPYTGREIVGFHGCCNDSYLESIEAIYKPVPHTPIGYSGIVFGPFGGAGEKSWHSNDINGISVSYRDFIRGITFEVDDDTSSTPIYGRQGKKKTFEVKLENPYECITSFSGYFENAHGGRILIKSLTFRTNKRILGPIGTEEGKHFSSPSPSEAVKVTRFFGRTVDNFLESIGAQVETYYPFKSVGLFGCSNASNWDDRDDDYTDVRKIIVAFELDDVKTVKSVKMTKEETFIQSITFCYEVKNDRTSQRKRHPEIPPEQAKLHTIDIDAGEHLTSLSGYYTEHGITSLTFGTDKRTFQLIGREEGIHFSSPVTGGKIVGFYGRSGEHLEAIGAYFEPISHLYPIKSIGPFGSSSGETWDHGKFKGVRGIEVKHHINIHYITFVYDDGGRGQSYQVENNGRDIRDNPKVNSVILDYPREYLTSISGYERNGTIQSLIFYSNKERYGPFGKEDGKYFWYPSNGSRITGFHGRWNPESGTLESIGVHVEPVPHLYPFKTVGPFGGNGGTPWDDGVHTDVRGFRISFGKAIEAIGIAYDDNGSFVLGPEHRIGCDNIGSFMFGLKPGQRGTDKYMEVLLDYPKERLHSISVWVDKDGNNGQSFIHDLEIYTTNKNKTYGPFISKKWKKRDKLTPLQIPSEEDGGRRIVGFLGNVGNVGNVGCYLQAIGARLEPYSD